MNTKRDYGVEMKDNEVLKCVYGFDFDAIQGFMMRSFDPFLVEGAVRELGSFEGDFTHRLLKYFDDVSCVEGSVDALVEARAKFGRSVAIFHYTDETAELPMKGPTRVPGLPEVSRLIECVSHTKQSIKLCNVRAIV